ncbi:hypothetical protein L1987_21885 [Smallanthus sonchifolius]|uniref:Uncharacterized protein n=1 Tax=Smallanthus sonchifolius TaxID=185202 RepID=A0ACB9IDV9_9ASTR|nr:hypothetical protein L1987_21885 [Smallanthus sonchifolius]
MHDAWHAGQPVVADPPIVDYSTLPPYDGSATYPTPPLHHSQWVDPHTGMGSQQADQGGDQGTKEFSLMHLTQGLKQAERDSIIIETNNKKGENELSSTVAYGGHRKLRWHLGNFLSTVKQFWTTVACCSPP